MSCGDCERVMPESDDATQFIDSLSHFKLRETALDLQGTGELAERCLTKFDDTDASLECRAMALYTLLAQITSGNAFMLAYIPDICARLQARSVLSQPVSGVGAVDFHREVISAISAILETAPERLVNESFGLTMQYLVRLVSSENVPIAILACDFWAKYAAVPQLTLVRKQWIVAFQPELSTLITSLMKQMIYRPVHSEYLEQFSSRCSSVERSSLPPDVEEFSNLRNVAAVAFEHVANVYPCEMVCNTFRPLLEKRIDSDSWEEKEAAILSLAAFTEGTGTPDVMRDCYAVVVPRIIDCYSDQQPLLRSIACFTMPKLVGHRLRGMKDPWSRVLTCTAKATRDSCPEVRSIATRALCTLLAYGTSSGGGGGRSAGVGGHAPRLVDALQRARQYEMDSETRCAYFECISHLVGRASDSLCPADMERLLPPLIDAWKALPWDRAMEGENSSTVDDPRLTIIPFTMALANIAAYGKSLYAPYAECVFEKACTDIEEIVKLAASKNCKENEDEDETGCTTSSAMMSHITCCLDLLSAIYDGLGSTAAQYAAKFQLLPRLHVTLTADGLNQRVYQTAFALLGHVLANDSGPTEPEVDVFLELIGARLDSAASVSSKIRGNVLWVLMHAVDNRSASDQLLLGLVERLIAIFKRTDDSPVCIIYAACAMTSICARRASEQVVVDIITRPDVFLHLCGLLRAKFPRTTEKIAIFTNVVCMLAAAVDKVPEELWPEFLLAVVADDQATMSDELGSSDLHVTLRSLLREVRSTLGSAGWTRALQEMGAQPASVLRRRYKLF